MIGQEGTPAYEIEIGEDRKRSTCACCGRESAVTHGFVYKDDNAYAVFFAGWAPGHADKKVTLATAIGEWDDNATSAGRSCFGVEACDGEEEVIFRVINPDESPWGETDLLGEMLSRQDALEHPLLQEVFVILEKVIRDHPAIRQYLAISK